MLTLIYFIYIQVYMSILVLYYTTDILIVNFLFFELYNQVLKSTFNE